MPSIVARYQWPEPKFGGLRNSFLHLLLRDTINNEAPDLMLPTSIVFEVGFPRWKFHYDPKTKEIRRETSGTMLQAAALFKGIVDSIKEFKLYLAALESQKERRKKYTIVKEKRRRRKLLLLQQLQHLQQQQQLEEDKNDPSSTSATTIAAGISSIQKQLENLNDNLVDEKDADDEFAYMYKVEDEKKFEELDHEQFLLDLVGEGTNDAGDDDSVGGANGTSLAEKYLMMMNNDDQEDENNKRKSSGSDIVAILIYSLPEDQQDEDEYDDTTTLEQQQNTSPTTRRRNVFHKNNSGGNKNNSAKSSGRITRMEPMTLASLKQFLMETTPTDPRRQHAVLQQIFTPDEANFTVSRVAWSPSVCLVSRRQSRHPFNDVRYTPAQRTLLFDALQEYSVEVHCAATTGAEIESACRDIALHIKRGSGLEVTDMLLYMMTSAGGRQVLLWAGGFDAIEKDEQQQNNNNITTMTSMNDENISLQNHQRNNKSKVPASALEGGTVELLDPNEKAENDELERLSNLEKSLQREFRGKIPSKMMATTRTKANNSKSNSKKKKFVTTPSPSPVHQTNEKSPTKSPKNTSPATSPTTATSSPVANATMNSSSLSSIVLEQKVSELFTSGWRDLDTKIPQHEETIRLAQHEIRLVVGSALYDYFSKEQQQQQQQEEEKDNHHHHDEHYLVIDSDQLNEIDRLLGSVNRRNDLFRSIGFEDEQQHDDDEAQMQPRTMCHEECGKSSTTTSRSSTSSATSTTMASSSPCTSSKSSIEENNSQQPENVLSQKNEKQQQEKGEEKEDDDDGDQTYEDDFVDDAEEEILDEDDEQDMSQQKEEKDDKKQDSTSVAVTVVEEGEDRKSSQSSSSSSSSSLESQQKASPPKKATIKKFIPLPTQHKRHLLTLHVATSLMEVWLSSFISKEMENLRQQYSRKIREAATMMALGI